MKSYVFLFILFSGLFHLSVYPAQATTDGDIRQKIAQHLQTERDIEQKIQLASQGETVSCSQFDGSTETRLFTDRNGEYYYVTVVGRANTKSGDDPIYTKLNSEAARFAKEACSMMGYSGIHEQYYHNGVCSNEDKTTHFAYRFVTGGFNCSLCDERCQANRQAQSEQHKNDSSFAIYQVRDNDKVIAVYKVEYSSLPAPIITQIPLATAPNKSTSEFPMFYTFSLQEWHDMVVQFEQKELDDSVTKRLGPNGTLTTYIVKRNGTVVGTYKVGEMQDGTREILPAKLSSNLNGVMMQTIEITEPGWNNIQAGIKGYATKNEYKTFWMRMVTQYHLFLSDFFANLNP